MNNPDFSRLTAYDLIDRQSIDAIGAVGFLLCHKKTKAKVALLLNDDNNKVFNIAFRTPCSDDTGVPHILEHSVLCGSEKFPVKDPFVELAKGSLNTFLNAMTSTVRTMYPLASCNDADFKNLMDVYLDAVFHPNIYKFKEIFMQEGWSYKLDSMDDELKISGVVYNEMKGAFSSPERIVYGAIKKHLNPDNQYKYESGGDPEFIPDLSYEEFLDYHRKYYHPSNSYIYLYGDLDAVERLEFIDREYLSKYDYLQVDSDVKEQKPLNEPADVSMTYSIGENEDDTHKTHIAYATTFGKITDVKIANAINVLEYALLTMPGAPVKKALIEAGLAKDVYGGSYPMKDNAFMFIAKGADAKDKEKIVEVIESTLKGLVEDGIDRDSLRAALNVFEFRYREADFGGYPKGLFYSLDVMESWLFDERYPFTLIDAADTFMYLNSVVETGYFESLIEEFILNNNHKLVLTVSPERGLTEKKEKALVKKLAEYKASLTQEELQQIIDETKHLEKYQSEPSSQEELETIPMLKLSDIDKLSRNVEYTVKDVAGTQVVHTDEFTNNIAYMTLSFDTAHISDELVPYIGLLKHIIGYVDTDNYEYAVLNNIINLHTGGMDTDTVMYKRADNSNEYTLRFEVSVKVFYEKIAKAFELMEEIIMHTKHDDRKRIKEIIGEIKAGLQSKAATGGQSFAVNRALSYFSESAVMSDKISGVDFVAFIEELDASFDDNADEIMEKLSKLIRTVFCKENLTVSCTVDEKGYEIVAAELEKFNMCLSDEVCQRAERKLVPTKKNEGLKTSAQIQYVARAGNFKLDGYQYSGALKVFENVMDYGYLWEYIRVKGGAYGCMIGTASGGTVYFCSYRDPNLQKTNEVYNGIPDYLRSFEESDRNNLRYIIGTISNLDRPKTARGKGDTSFRCYMCGVTMDMIQKERDEVLSFTNEKMQQLADLIEAVLAQDNICVVGNAGKIEECKEMFMETRDLLS